MKTPKTPEGWACRLAAIVYKVKDAHGESRFPINVREIAIDYSKSVFPDDPITEIGGIDECEGFEGMLVRIPPKKKTWGLLYNKSGNSMGRINFSISHELGHYLLHRHKFPDGKRCTTQDMMDWNSEAAQIEGEANRFASNLLMPLDDFRNQVGSKEINFDLFSELAERYQVSLTASILRWLGYTDQRAMIVVGKDGFIDWAWSSQSLMKSKIYYRPRQETIELPRLSLAAQRNAAIDNRSGIKHPSGIWLGDEEVREMTIFPKEYGNMTISLLKYPKIYDSKAIYEEDTEEDLVDRLNMRFQRTGL